MKARFMPKKVHPMLEGGPCTSEKGNPDQATPKSWRGSSRVNRYIHSDASVLRWLSKPSSLNAPPAQSPPQSSSAVRTSPLSSRGSDTSEPPQHEKSSSRSKPANVDKKERRRCSNARRPTTEGFAESWHFSNWDDVDCRHSDSNSVCSSQNSLYVDLD